VILFDESCELNAAPHEPAPALLDWQLQQSLPHTMLCCPAATVFADSQPTMLSHAWDVSESA
jgi:hypothetical protein